MGMLGRLIPKSKKGKLAGIAGVIFGFYLVFGFFLLPLLVLPKLTAALSEATHRDARIQELHINPLELSVRVQQFELIDRNGEKFVGFDELYVNYDAIALLTGAIGFDEIRLRAPIVRVAIGRDGRYNFSDLVASETAQEKPAASAPVTVNVTKFRLDNGNIIFADASRTTPFRAELKTLSLGLDKFTTRPDREGRYSLQAITGDGEMLKWSGEIGLSPLRSTGSLELTNLRAHTLWSYVQDQLGFVIDRGLLDASADYALDFSPGKTVTRLDRVTLRVRDLNLVDVKQKQSVFALNAFTVRETTIDVVQRSIDVGMIESDKGQLNLVRAADGRLDVANLLVPPGVNASAPAPAANPASPPAPAWGVRVRAAKINNWGAIFVDKMTTPNANLSLAPINIEVNNVDLVANTPMKLDFDMGVNNAGKLRGHGEVIPSPLSSVLQLDLETIDLTPLRPYLANMTRMQLASGNINAHLNLKGGATDTGFNAEVTGGVALRQFRGIDPVLNEDLVRLEDLSVKDLRYTTQPPALVIKEVAVAAPYLRMIIGADGTTNLQHVQVATPASVRSEKPVAETKPVASEPPMLVKIGTVSIHNGSVNFADQSLSPNFDVGIQSLNGSILGLSSKDIARATVTLDGKVDKYAPATVRGKINPLSDNAFTDVVVAFHGVEMTTFTPYSAKFAGHKIDKGKLNIDLHYLLSQNVLKGENKVVLDQLELGEKVDSPEAVGLPVRLALALLKDANGVIDVDLPITGSLDDPDFHYGKFVWQAIKNIIVKAATAPFRLLAGALNGDDNALDRVRFAPNDARLTPAEQEKLLKLADALNKRTALSLALRGSAGEVDRRAMAVALAGPVASEKLAPPQGAAVQPPPAPSPPVVTDEDLRALAQARAEASLDFLIQAGKLDPQRVFMLEVDTHAVGDEFVDVPLAVQVR